MVREPCDEKLLGKQIHNSILQTMLFEPPRVPAVTLHPRSPDHIRTYKYKL
jgi:hypothetical protein